MFRRSAAGSDTYSETSSVGQAEEVPRETTPLPPASEEGVTEPPQEEPEPPSSSLPDDQRQPDGQESEEVDPIR